MIIRKAYKFRLKTTPDINAKMVKQKSGLNRVILNQGWGMFKEMLKYKQDWRGGQVIFVEPKHSVQRVVINQKITD